MIYLHSKRTFCDYSYVFNGLVNLQKTVESLHDLNDSDEKTRWLKTPSKNSNPFKSYTNLKIMQISI